MALVHNDKRIQIPLVNKLAFQLFPQKFVDGTWSPSQKNSPVNLLSDASHPFQIEGFVDSFEYDSFVKSYNQMLIQLAEIDITQQEKTTKDIKRVTLENQPSCWVIMCPCIFGKLSSVLDELQAKNQEIVATAVQNQLMARMELCDLLQRRVDDYCQVTKSRNVHVSNDNGYINIYLP